MLKKLKGTLKVNKKEIIGIASTEDTDRHGEVVKQDGWDLKNFLNNPAFMLSHNYEDFPIGKVEDIRVEDNKLKFKAVFTEATQKAKEAYQLVKEGVLNSFSVGFIPKEFDEKNRDIITKAELLEISLVAIPANPNAIVVAKSIKKNELAEEMLVNWLAKKKAEGGKMGKVKMMMDEMVGEMGSMQEMEDIEKMKVQAGKTKAKMQKASGMIEEMMNEKKSVKNLNNAVPAVPEKDKGGEVDSLVENIDQKMLQKTVGFLQDICRIKKIRKESEK